MSGSPMWQSIAARATQHPDHPWLTFDAGSFTWREALERINEVANFLAESGLQPGDTVALMLGNQPEMVWAHIGTIAAGGIPVPVNLRQRGAALRYLFADCDAEVAVVQAELLSTVEPMLTEIGRYRHLVVVGGDPGRHTAWEDVARFSNATPEPSLPAGHMDRTLSYTSGTTGPPKGLIAVKRDSTSRTPLLAALDVAPGELMYTTLPLFHGNAMTTILNSVLLDARVAVARRFSASNFWAECRRHGAVLTNTIGGMVSILLNQPSGPGDRDHGVRRVLSAGCPRERWTEFEERFGVKLIEFYGMVDAAGFLLNTSGKVGSMGRPMSGVEFRVVDDNDVPVPSGIIGELQIRHPDGIVREYYKQPELTRQAHRGGWFHTGDLASVDEDGFYYYQGRKKDSIRKGGENISAWEVESVIDMHPAVAATAAYGVRSELGEQDLMVAIEPEPGQRPTADEIREFCHGRVADYATPRYIRFVESLPRTGTQRIQKAVLAAEGVTADTIDLVARRP